MRPPPPPPAFVPGAAGGAVDKVVLGCLTVLCVLQRVCAGEPLPPPAIEASLELSIAALQHADTSANGDSCGAGGGPAAANGSETGPANPNAQLYTQIADAVRALKSQLVAAGAPQ
jgi:hypothetical protein